MAQTGGQVSEREAQPQPRRQDVLPFPMFQVDLSQLSETWDQRETQDPAILLGIKAGHYHSIFRFPL